jgi:hypothetical protein
MKSYILAGVAAAAAVVLALGADRPATPSPLQFMAQDGQVAVKGEHFVGAADRAELDQAANTLTLAGRDGKPASMFFQWPNMPPNKVSAGVISVNLATGAVQSHNKEAAVAAPRPGG